MLKHLFPLAVLLAIPVIGGAQTKPGPPADPVAAAPRISVADAQKALDAGKARLVEVRSAQS
jgi:hypothetical protein